MPFADEQNYPAWQWVRGAGGYLPAKNELSTLMSNKSTVNSALNKLGASQIDGAYWSSTAISNSQAYYMNSSSTTGMMGNLTTEYSVCAIKKF